MRHLIALLLLSFSLHSVPPKAVIFDFGGVVAKVDRKPMLEYLSKTMGKSYKAIKKEFSGEALYIALEKPYCFWESYAKTPLDHNWKQEFEATKRLLVREIPGMRALIDQLKGQGVQVALLSNTKENRARFIEKMGGYAHFDPILLSCYLGAKKPDAEIYSLLMNHLAWDPSECLFIDNRKANVRQAKKQGIDSIHFRGLDELREALKTRHLDF